MGERSLGARIYPGMDSSQSQTWGDLDVIPRAHRIFVANYDELASRLRIQEDPQKWLAVGSGGHDPLLREVDRLLHNFLAAAYTLSATIYKVAERRWAQGTDEREAYEAENARRGGVSAFVFGLRNIAQHDTIPLARGQLSWQRNLDGSGTFSGSINLDREALLSLDWRRSLRGREYLDGLGHDPDLREITETFTRGAVAFTAWVYDQIKGDVALLPPQLRRAAKEWRASINDPEPPEVYDA